MVTTEVDLLTGLLFDELLYLEAVHVFIWLSPHRIFWPVWILHVDDVSSVHLNGRFITCRPSTKSLGVESKWFSKVASHALWKNTLRDIASSALNGVASGLRLSSGLTEGFTGGGVGRVALIGNILGHWKGQADMPP